MPKIKNKQTRIELAAEFDAAPVSTMFDQIVVAAVLDCTTYTMERQRFNGNGIPFIKIGRSVRYRKSDVLAWLDQFKTQTSTSENGQ